MKKLGLIGGIGPEASVTYYREITSGVQKQLAAPVYPPLTIESIDVFKVLDYCAKNDFESLMEYVLEGIQNLKNAGCEACALTGVTVHHDIEKIQLLSPIPVISMLDAARDFALMKGYRKILLLGTEATMKGNFFQRSFADADIDTVIPNSEDIQYIGNIISNELEYGIVREESASHIISIIRNLKDTKKIDAAVLGCTELPMILNDKNTGMPTLNMMEIHITSLIDYIVHD